MLPERRWKRVTPSVAIAPRMTPIVAMSCALMAIGCGGAPATGYCPQGDRNAAQSCFVSTNAAGATTVAATAGALWPIAGGCKVAGCEPPLVCNRDNGFCELPRCDEAQRCPTNLHCNVSTERCER